MQQEMSVILAQKLVRLIGNPRLRRALTALVLPFVGVVAAFGIAPDTITDTVPKTRVVEVLALPTPELHAAADPGYWREERIQRGDTVAALLARLGADDPDAVEFLRTARTARIKDPRGRLVAHELREPGPERADGRDEFVHKSLFRVT